MLDKESTPKLIIHLYLINRLPLVVFKKSSHQVCSVKFRLQEKKSIVRLKKKKTEKLKRGGRKKKLLKVGKTVTEIESKSRQSKQSVTSEA